MLNVNIYVFLALIFNRMSNATVNGTVYADLTDCQLRLKISTNGEKCLCYFISKTYQYSYTLMKTLYTS